MEENVGGKITKNLTSQCWMDHLSEQEVTENTTESEMAKYTVRKWGLQQINGNDGKSRGNQQHNFLTWATKGQIFVRSLEKLFRNYKTEEGQPPLPPEICDSPHWWELQAMAGLEETAKFVMTRQLSANSKKTSTCSQARLREKRGWTGGFPSAQQLKNPPVTQVTWATVQRGTKSRSWLSDWACTSACAGRQLGETRTHTEGRQVRGKMEAEKLALLKAAEQK